MSFKEQCIKSTAHLLYSDDLKLAVIENKSKEEFKSLGGTEEIYYNIKPFVNQVAQDMLNEIEQAYQETNDSLEQS